MKLTTNKKYNTSILTHSIMLLQLLLAAAIPAISWLQLSHLGELPSEQLPCSPGAHLACL